MVLHGFTWFYMDLHGFAAIVFPAYRAQAVSLLSDLLPADSLPTP